MKHKKYFFIYTLLVTLIVTELFLHVFKKIDIKKRSDNIRSRSTKGVQGKIRQHFLNLKNQAKIPHPYFGYVYNKALKNNVNKDGFFDEQDFSKIKSGSKGSFNIGIFGGSVAKEFAVYQKRKGNPLISQLKSSLHHYFGNKKVKILNFGITSYKQPQQFFVSSYYSEKLDMAITIDGYNEIRKVQYPEFPFSFPSYSNLFYGHDPARNKYLEKIYSVLDSRVKWLDFIENSFLKNIMIVRYIWIIIDKKKEREIINAHSGFVSSLDRKYPYYKGKLLNESEQLKELTQLWMKYTRKQINYLNFLNIKNFNFIQPNQHVMNSKELSPKEKKYFLDKENESQINEGYKYLESNLSLLHQEGLRAYSLINIFKDIKETTYRDSCCHLNNLGNSILGKKISKIIIKSLKDDGIK